MKYISRILKKIKPNTIINSKIHKDSKVESGSYLSNTVINRFSYCGYDCTLINVCLGAFCSIASNVKIGLSNHPINWVSTSPTFYKGRDSISKRLASLSYDSIHKGVIIGNDVWIGENVIILDGVKIGDGAIIGAGSIVTKDIGPYEIVAGSPARLIKKRFDEKTIEKLIAIKWWDFEESKLKQLSNLFDDVDRFIKKVEEINK